MKTGTILNMDMASLGRQLQQWGRWWLDEMSGMLPVSMQSQKRPFIGTVVDALPDNSFRVGNEQLSGNANRKRPATILLDEARLLVRDMSLPAMRPAELRKLVALNIDRLMPFPADSVYMDVSKRGLVDDKGQASARIAAIPKVELAAIYDAALAHDLVPRAIGVSDESGKRLEFDFLPEMLAASGAQTVSGARRWWILVAVLFLANIGVLIWKDVRRVSALERLVEAQQPLVNASRKLALKLTDEDRLRAELIEARRKNNALTALAFVTRIVPSDAWAERYSWNSEVLRISGYKSAQTDVLGALRKSGSFATVRATTSDVATESATGQPFDVTAEWKPQ